MGATYHKIFYHLIWGTYKRLELIDGSIEQHLKKLIEYKLQEFNSKLLCFGCTGDHVHLLVQAHSSISVAELAGSIKGYSSYMLSNQICPN